MTMRADEAALDAEALVLIVDDDADVRAGLVNLLKSVGLGTVEFSSAAEFLEYERPQTSTCLVLDIRLPGISGLDFQALLAKRGVDIPIVFMTGYGDVPMAARAFKAGALDFLLKPFHDQDMLDAVHRALDRDRSTRLNRRTIAELQSRYQTLSPREIEIMELVCAGLMNKQIAAEMNLSEITIKIYRGHMMRKMGAKTLADLVRYVEALSAG